MKDKKIFINDINKFVATIGKKLATKYNKNHPTHQPIKTSARFKLQTVTENQIEKTVINMKNTKSEGFDKISIEIIKKNIHNLKTSIKEIINKTIQTGKIADKMKITKITPVYKDGDPSDCSNYRPICLLPIINKILEKIVNEQLMNYLEQNNLLCSHQFGFRQKSNTDTALFDFITVIQRALDRKKKVGAVFIDKKKAFETVDQKILLQKMSSLGIIGTEHMFFQDYFSGRKQYVAAEGTETNMESTSIGVPQGANLASTLFLIYIDDIKNIHIDGHVFLYSDDIAIVTIEENYIKLNEKMNRNCDKMQRWMTCNKLTLNTRKTKYIIFRTPINQSMRIIYDGVELERAETVKYLGVLIDMNLNWKAHIEQTRNNLAAITGIFRKIAKYIPEENKRQLYFSMFSSRLTYGILVWSAAYETDLKQIQNLQNKALRNLFQYDRMERTELIHTENNILTIKQQIHHRLATHIHNIKHEYTKSTTTLTLNEQYHDHNTRNATNIRTERKRTERYGTKQPLNVAIQIYNSLPDTMKTLNRQQFKMTSKEHFKSKFDI